MNSLLPVGRSFPIAFFLCAALLARADVIINEVMTAGSERLLQWSAGGVPQFGFGTPWQAPAFDDSSWQTGNGPFGFGSFTNVLPAPAVGTNTASQMQNLTPTLYLRKAFTATAAQAARADALVLDVQFNDGFICYVNGVEVVRRNAGPAGQFTYHDQFAAHGTPANNEASTNPYLRTETLTLPAASSLLVPGNNVIAIHALNYGMSSNEITYPVNSSNATVTVNTHHTNFYFKADLRIGSDAPIVANNSAWRYFPGVTEPSGGVHDPALLFSGKQNVPWGRGSFDDTGWVSGAAPFGFGTPPTGITYGTTLSGVQNVTPSVYFRIVFNVTELDLADPAAMQLLLGYDDGFVAYINGVEVARQNMGDPNKFTPHDAVTTAAGVNTGASYTLAPPAAMLTLGANVLAVQLHNVTAADADLFFRARLQRNGAARILVDYGNTWRYFVGTGEPIQEVGEADEENPEAPESQLDWLELHNNGATSMDLSGHTLSDDPQEPGKWAFPAGTTIAPGAYLLIICDGQNIVAPPANGFLHTNFKLSADGETVGLYNPAGGIVQELAIPPLTPFGSYGLSGGQYRYLALPSPRAANTGSALEGVVAAPTFSPANGMITGSTQTSVTISLASATPGATIRFTEDGSEPTETTGTLYTGPFTRSQPTQNGAGFAIRARAFKSGWTPSATRTNTYILNQSAARLSLPALSITGDPQRSLYRPFGIMAIDPITPVNGVGGYITATTTGTNINSMWTQAGVNDRTLAPNLAGYNNPTHRGRFIERPAVMEMLYSGATPAATAPPGAPPLSIDFGMRISGSAHARPRYVLTSQNSATPNAGTWSSSAQQKPSFNFFFRGDLGGDPLQYPLFPLSPLTEFHDIRVRAGKNELTARFAVDEMMRRTFVATGQVGSVGRFVHLYVNGVYKSWYNPCEHIREDFLQRQHGSELPWDVRQVSVIASGDGLAFQEMITFVRNNPQSVLANFQAMKARLDMVNFIDYLIVNLYGVTGDWPHNNYVCARERSANGLHRYYLWDAEGAMGGGFTPSGVRTNQFVSDGSQASIETSTGTTDPAQGIRILYTHLQNSPEFRQLFADRLQKHFFDGGALENENLLARWSVLVNEMSQVSAQNSSVANWITGVGDITKYTTGSTTNTPSRRQVLFHGYLDEVAGGIPRPAQLVAEGLWPATLAPDFSQHGGPVAPGFQLTIANPNGAGTVYYTTDGRDPRLDGGAVANGALTYSAPISIQYSTTIRARVRSAGGEWSPLVEANFNTGSALPLLITEIMYHPKNQGAVDGDEYEFIELKNVGAQTLNLNGITFTSGIAFTFPAGATLAPGGFAVIARNAAQFAARYPGVPVAGSYGPGGSLDNAGEPLTLKDLAGNTIVTLTYDDGIPWPEAADGGGPSIVPVNPNSNPSPGVATSWRASTNLHGSPGADDPTPTIRINEILANAAAGQKDSIELYNPTAGAVNVGGWFLSDSAAMPKKYAIPANTSVAAGGYLVLNEDQFNPTPGAGNSFALSGNGDDVVLSAADGAGNLTGYQHVVAFGASSPGASFGRHVISTGDERFPAQRSLTLGGANSGPAIGPVVVTEMMYLPATGGDDFIELRNISAANVPLFDPANPANTWRVSGVDFNFPPGVTLGPGDIVLLTKLDPASFRTKYGVPAAIEIYAYPSNLSDNGEPVAVRKPAAPVTGQPLEYIDVDAFTYAAIAPWPTAASGFTRSPLPTIRPTGRRARAPAGRPRASRR
jgi:hypothetical protein